MTAEEHVPAGLLARVCSTPDAAATFGGVLLFTDIVGSTALTKRFAAEGDTGIERLSQVLNDYFERVFSVVAAHGGEILRLEGDAAFAVWLVDPAEPLRATAMAAAAALALEHETVFEGGEDVPATHHRLAVAAGPLHARVHEVDDTRAFLLVRGAPLDELRGPLAQGPGGQILLSDTARRELASVAEFAEGVSHARLLALKEPPASEAPRPPGGRVPGHELIAEVAPKLVSSAVRARLGSQLRHWLAEFRQISVVQIGLPESVGTPGYNVRRPLMLVERALVPLRAGVREVSFGDKGAVLTVVFGLPPFAREHGARWAVEAAQKTAATLRQHEIAADIGVATGEALYGEVGSRDRRSEYLTGAVMARATRLMQAADAEILCDVDTVQACERAYRFAEAGRIVVKTGEDAIPAHRLAGAMASPEHAVAAPLIGRAEELERIADHLAATAPAAPVLAIEAEPGAGKSHLLSAANDAAEQAGFAVCQAIANPIETSTPYFVFGQILPWLLDAGSEIDDVRKAIRRVLSHHPLRDTSAAIDAVIAIGWAGSDAPSLGAGGRASAIEEIVVQLALARSRGARIVLSVDDAQWLDDASARLLLAIVERVSDCRLLAAARPPEDAGLAPTGLLAKAAKLRLRPLADAEIGEIVRRLLGADELPDRLSALLAERAEGIPLYAEQFIFALRQRGLIEVVNGRCHLKADDIQIMSEPRSIRELIAGRLDLLPRLDQVIVKAASVIGREFSLDLLAAISPVRLERRQLALSAGGLASSGFLSAVAPDLPDVWTFRHRVIRDTIYGALTTEQRRPLHAAIAGWLRRKHAAEPAPIYGMLAEHYEGAAQPEPAMEFGVRAAEQALERFASADALARLERVRTLIEANEAAVDDAQRAHVALLSGRAYYGLSRFAEAHDHFRQYAELSGISLPLGKRQILQRVPAEVIEQVGRRLTLLRRAGAEDARAESLVLSEIFTAFAEQAFFDNDPLRLFFYTLSALNRAERAGADRETAVGLGAITIGLGGAGMHRLARVYREKSIAAAERTGDPASVGFTYLLATVYSTAAGDWSAVWRCGEAGYEWSMRAGDRHRAQSCHLLLAFSSMWRGRFEEAEEYFSEFGANAEAARNVPVRSWVRVGRVIFDLAVQGTDEGALGRVSIAEDPELPRAERLMCRGLRAALLWRQGQRDRALEEAGAVLAGMKVSPVTLGIALDSITAVALVHFAALRERQSRSRSLLEASRDACLVAATFSRQNLIGRPRSLLLDGRLAQLRGRRRRAARRYRQAAQSAARLELPMDEAAALAALASATGERAPTDRSREIMRELGARPWFLDLLGLEDANPISRGRRLHA